MTRSEVKALRRLVKADEDLAGYISRLNSAAFQGAGSARFGTTVKTSEGWATQDWSVILPISIAIEMAEMAQMAVRKELKAKGVTK